MHTGCPITHGIYCKKSAKTKCQFKKRLGGKKVKFNVKKIILRKVKSKAEYIRRVEDEKSSP
jgi:hypothetical protein